MAAEFWKKAGSTFDGYEITVDQINALKDCVDGLTSSEDAAKRLASYTEGSPTPMDAQQRLGGLWTLLNDTAVALPSSQTTIISILSAIRTLPKARVPKGEGEEYIDLDDGFYWKELTGWANNWADAFNSHSSGFLIDQHSDPNKKAARKEAWKNACAYTARLAATGDAALSSYGGGLDRASRAIAEALEVDHGDHEPESTDAAAQLFIHAADDLYQRCKEGRTEGMLTTTNGIWDGADGYSEERWRFWKERWSHLAGVQSSSAQGQSTATDALRTMKAAESAGA